MAIRNASFELTTGCELSGVAAAIGLSGGAIRTTRFVQPDWFDTAGLPNRVQKIGLKAGTLAAAATATIDLTALDGIDGGSGTVDLSTLVACYIQITGTTGLLRIGNAAADAHPLDFGADTHTRTLRPQSPGHAVGDYGGTGYAVSASAKNVRLENTHGSESVTYVAYFAGR